MTDEDLVLNQMCAFYTPDKAREWFNTPQKHFNGESPSSLFKQGRGKEVVEFVKEVADCVYT